MSSDKKWIGVILFVLLGLCLARYIETTNQKKELIAMQSQNQ